MFAKEKQKQQPLKFTAMKYKVTTIGQKVIFNTNSLAAATEAAMDYSEANGKSTFVWRKGQRACTYWIHREQDGTFTMYRGAGRK